jgi:hypothetical protein
METGKPRQETGKTETGDRGKSCEGLRSFEVYRLENTFPEINNGIIYCHCPWHSRLNILKEYLISGLEYFYSVLVMIYKEFSRINFG